MLFDGLALFSFLVVLLLLRRLVNIFPSMLACLMRGKECFNLEASVKLAHDRNIIAAAMIIPCCLVMFRYRIYSPAFLADFDGNSLLGLYFAVFFAYVMLRASVSMLLRPRHMPSKVCSAVSGASATFFIMLTLLLLAMGGVMGFLHLGDDLVRSAMLWVSAAIYMLFLLRKMQIFASSCSIFAAFLYLCTLEMIPTGILIVSAIVF